MGSERFDSSLLDGMEEWVTIKSSILYVQMVYGLTLDSQAIWLLGGKFGFIKDFAGSPLVHARTLDKTVARCYFPVIPKGYLTVDAVVAKYPLFTRQAVQSFIRSKKVSIRKIEIGTEEIDFIEERGIQRLHKARIAEHEARRARDPFRNKRVGEGGRRLRRVKKERKKSEIRNREYQKRLDRLIKELEEDGVDTQRLRSN